MVREADSIDRHIREGALAAPHVEAIQQILEADVFEDEMGRMARDYVKDNFRDIDEYSVVCAVLGALHIISAYNFRRVLES